MGIVLGTNQYGKAENRVVRIYRDTDRHQIRDVCVSTTLRGDFVAAHQQGNQARVLPTDTQKNTCYAFAKEHGVGEIEDYALGLAHHFVNDIDPVEEARIEVEEYAWERAEVGGPGRLQGHDHTWVRRGPEVRTTVVMVDGAGVQVVSGLRDLMLLKSTGSEFAGFLRDHYTTLAETHDRVLATSLVARWRYASAHVDWKKTYDDVRQLLIAQFATVHSRALQQTLWEMGKVVLMIHPEIAEIAFSAPNKHHVAVDLTPFGLENPGEVFYVTDRPYGLIECTVTRDGAA
jgi:urate oxidase